MDLGELDYEAFELLVGMLLVAEGFTITRTPHEGRDVGLDFDAVSPDGSNVYVEVKHFRRSPRLPMSVFHAFTAELERLRQQRPGARGIFVLSGSLTESAATAASGIRHLQVWNGDDIRRLLLRHPGLFESAKTAAGHRAQVMARLRGLKVPASPPERASARLVAELASLRPGRTEWRAYENLGARTLTEIFEPELGAPDIQSRSEDGLDIMDAIFPIRATVPPWSLVRSEYQSRFMVAEFKNHSAQIGQTEVESLAQYLWKKAHRSFGFLVSRKGPDESALRARRRAWVENDKLIVFVTDDDLVDLVQLWEEDDDPFQVIDAQLEEFFRRLSP